MLRRRQALSPFVSVSVGVFSSFVFVSPSLVFGRSVVRVRLAQRRRGVPASKANMVAGAPSCHVLLAFVALCCCRYFTAYMRLLLLLLLLLQCIIFRDFAVDALRLLRSFFLIILWLLWCYFAVTSP